MPRLCISRMARTAAFMSVSYLFGFLLRIPKYLCVFQGSNQPVQSGNNDILGFILLQIIHGCQETVSIFIFQSMLRGESYLAR